MGRKALPTDEMNLTEREHRVLDFMTKTALEKGYPPTVRELCEELNVKSTSTIHKDLSSLERKGFIRKDPAKPRAIEIVGLDRLRNRSASGAEIPEAAEAADLPAAEAAAASLRAAAAGLQAGADVTAHRASGGRPGAGSSAAAETPLPSLSSRTRSDILDIPLVGQVAAGTPILAEENITDTFPIPARYVGTDGDHFMLAVRGESMIEAGILDGDYILVRQQGTAQNGQMVVAMVDGFESEATVKTFYREKDHIRLQPENSSMSPILVRDVKILGVVKGVFRYLS